MQAPFDIVADLDTPVSAFLKLESFKPCFLLESVEGGERLARYSFLGLGERVRLELLSDELKLNGESRPRPADGAAWLATLREALNESPSLAPAIDGIPFAGGLVGAAGYDVVRYFERIPDNREELDGLPQAAYVAPESLLIFDHLTRRVALLHSGSETERRALRSNIIATLRSGIDMTPQRGSFSKASGSLSHKEFMEIVGTAKDHITAGDIYQIVLSIRFSGITDLDPFQCYRALRLLNPSPYLFFLNLGDLKVAGSSPEALVKLDGRSASLCPIAGTRPRGQTEEEDLALEQELLADPKELAEHVMLVDLARNDQPAQCLDLQWTGDSLQVAQEKIAHVRRPESPGCSS